MKFKSKKTSEIVEVKGYVQEFAYSHNSEWKKVEETKFKELTKAEIQAKLDELGIEYDKNAKKEELMVLLPQE